MSGIKTPNELKQEWGLERYVPALGKVSAFMLNRHHPYSREEMQSLKDNSEDAFTVFTAIMLHGFDD